MMLAITGYSGFVGDVLFHKLANFNPACIGRVRPRFIDCNNFISYDLFTRKNITTQLNDIEVVIHCAGLAHIMNDTSSNPLDEFREINTYGTLNLAQQAADAGVKRFIFISSIKVNGESTELGLPFKPDDIFIPTDPYGLSKYEAEIGLYKIAVQTGMEVVIIRPPLVYGPGVKANFASMMKWVYKGVPLPLGGITENKRSLVSVTNLVDLIFTCIDHPNAINQTFLVSDDDDVSTTELLANMAFALPVTNRLIPIPSKWFTVVSRLIGKPAISQRLCGSLQVDISKTKELLNWQPPYSSAESMINTANAFLENLSSEKSLHKKRIN
jgi:UDP-glucose 4-epimerase